MADVQYVGIYISQFSFGKCKCLHTGHGNLNYNMGDIVLGTTVKENDLGITISADMNVSEQWYCSFKG